MDPVHLAIVYEYSTWKKRTLGSRFLREIMVKFTVHDASLDADFWGEPYTGDNAIPLNKEEDIYRTYILGQSMHKTQAQRIRDTIDTTKPFYSRVEFLEAIAALCALHKEEVNRKVMSANKVIFRVLWS